MSGTEALKVELLKLNEPQRIELAEVLLGSLGSPRFDVVGAEYEREILDRARNAEQRKATAIPWSKVKTDLLAKLG